MLPLHYALELRSSTLEYLRTTFAFRDKALGRAFDKFLRDEETGLFRGPYLSLRLPYATIDDVAPEEGGKRLLSFDPGVRPYWHQWQAWKRLSTLGGHEPEPTILTTGTGSGKTESFLYPLVDYCLQRAHEPSARGMKAIILYPMNALATDQAQRLARFLGRFASVEAGSGERHYPVTAGLLLGEDRLRAGEAARQKHRTMGPDHLIDDRETLLKCPPDILLTNYKMLDYMLMRQEFRHMWEQQRGGETVLAPLKFIVLDELHTYDGAQGTDVAGLIRRLKLRLGLPAGTLCPIGTSATLGTGAESREQLAEFASDLFGEEISVGCIIGEKRLGRSAYLTGTLGRLPSIESLPALQWRTEDTPQDYIDRVAEAWFGAELQPTVECAVTSLSWCHRLAERLHRLHLMALVAELLEDRPLALEALHRQLCQRYPAYARLTAGSGSTESWGRTAEMPYSVVLESLTALMSWARRLIVTTEGEQRGLPFVYLQAQLWMREVSGLLRQVGAEPAFRWRQEGAVHQSLQVAALPMYHCRHCGASGWISTITETASQYEQDARRIGTDWVHHAKRLVLLTPMCGKPQPGSDEYAEDQLYKQAGGLSDYCWIEPHTLAKYDRAQAGTLCVRVSKCTRVWKERDSTFERVCPCCADPNVGFVGHRSSTLSGVGLSQIMGSSFDTPEGDSRRLLVFTNSVQDSAFVAGQYESNSSRFLLRQSLMQSLRGILRQGDRELRLSELYDRFRDYWQERLASQRAYHLRFLPHDQARAEDLQRRFYDGDVPRECFPEQFHDRLCWQINSEFALSSQMGRTLELTGTAAPYIRPQSLGAVIDRLERVLDEPDPLPAGTSAAQDLFGQDRASYAPILSHEELRSALQSVLQQRTRLVQFLSGWMQYLRQGGGISHPYMQVYRTRVLSRWGLQHPYHLEGKRPRLLHELNPQRFGGPKTKYQFTPRMLWLPEMVEHCWDGSDAKKMRPRLEMPLLERAQADRGATRCESVRVPWTLGYLTKYFPEIKFAQQPLLYNEFIRLVIQCALTEKLLDDEEITLSLGQQKGRMTYHSFMLQPSALWITQDVQHYRCDHCSHELHTAAKDNLATGMHCLQPACSGCYQLVSAPKHSYYQRFYQESDGPRIYARDHTGLLSREVREALERRFKQHGVPAETPAGQQTTPVNVLTATSTLEMGIDIGDLNSMFNLGLPPTVSNFVQRTGRVGRQGGASFVMNYAGSERHDQYYFTYPEEMLAGEVTPPGCYLEARDILRRQFLAYGIDCWTQSSEGNRLPFLMGQLQLSLISSPEPDKTENNAERQLLALARYLRTHQSELLSRFREQFGPGSQSALDELRPQDSSSQLDQRLIQTIDAQRARFRHLLEELRSSRNELIRLKGLPDSAIADEGRQERIRELKQQITALKQHQKKIKSQLVLEFMTSEGLIPNYAFPESGVTLSGSVYLKPRATAETAPAKSHKAVENIELVRPASQALRELAPGNHFYSQGYRFDITRLMTHDWRERKQTMHYCHNCDALVPLSENGEEQQTCPKCGDAGWAKQRGEFLRFSGVRSVMQEQRARLTEVKEERDKELYQTFKHFMIQQTTHGRPAYAMEELGFGIEYCPHIDLYEVNYGFKSEGASLNPITVAGEKIPAAGFTVCRHCGHVYDPRREGGNREKQGEKDTSLYHDRFCSYAKADPNNEADREHFVKSLYLYRQMQTEAIKILLPMSQGAKGLHGTKSTANAEERATENTTRQAMLTMMKTGLELGLKRYFHSRADHLKLDDYQEYDPETGRNLQYLLLYDTIPGGTGYLSRLYSPEQFSEVLRLAYEAIHNCECQHEGRDGCYHCVLSYGNQYSQQPPSRQQTAQLLRRLVRGRASWRELPSSGVSHIAQLGGGASSELEHLFFDQLRQLDQLADWSVRSLCDGRYELTIQVDEGTEFRYHMDSQYTLNPAHHGVRYTTVPDFLFICVYARYQGTEIPDPERRLPWHAVYTDGFEYHASRAHRRFYSDFDKREGIRLGSEQRIFSWVLTWDDVTDFDPKSLSLENIPWSNGMILLCRMLRSGLPLEMIKEVHPEVKRLFFSRAKPEDQIPTYRESRALYHLVMQFHQPKRDAGSAAETDLLAKKEAVYQSNRLGCRWQLSPVEVEDIDKDEWRAFWQRYNLLQLYAPQSEDEEDSLEVSREEVQSYYPGYEALVNFLLDHTVPFSHEGEVELTDTQGRVIATAGLLLDEPKIAIDPEREQDARLFREYGYRILYSEGLDYNSLLNNE